MFSLPRYGTHRDSSCGLDRFRLVLRLPFGFFDITGFCTIWLEHRSTRIHPDVCLFNESNDWTDLSLRCLALGAIFGFATSFHQERLYAKRAKKSPSGRAPPEARLYYAAFVGLAFPLGLFGFAWTGRPEVQYVILAILLGFAKGIVGLYQPSFWSSQIVVSTTCMSGYCELFRCMAWKRTDKIAITSQMRMRPTAPVPKLLNLAFEILVLPLYRSSLSRW
jgi:hypothetical protein